MELTDHIVLRDRYGVLHKLRLKGRASEVFLEDGRSLETAAAALGQAIETVRGTVGSIQIPTSLPASDVYPWAKAAQKPGYTAAEVGAVPTTRKVNGKALSGDITLSAADVGARPSSWTPTAAQVGAQAALGFTPVQQGGGVGQLANKVKIGWSGSKLKATVDATDIGNFSFEGHTHTAAQLGACQVAVGTYVGNSNSLTCGWADNHTGSEQKITLGFTPKAVLVMRDEACISGFFLNQNVKYQYDDDKFRKVEVYGALAVTGQPCELGDYSSSINGGWRYVAALEIVEGGFLVRSVYGNTGGSSQTTRYVYLNKKDTTYRYVAIG